MISMRNLDANELLQDSLDDVIASLIDLDEDDISENSSTGQTHIDKELYEMLKVLILKWSDLLCLPNERLGKYRKL